jgi:outer membrane biosynthesis protein TonB
MTSLTLSPQLIACPIQPARGDRAILASARREFFLNEGPALSRRDESAGRVPGTVRLLTLLVAIVLAGLLSQPGRAADAPVVEDPTVSGDLGGATSSEDTLGSSPADGSEPAPADTVEPVPGDTVEPAPTPETPPGDTVEPAPTPETPPSDTVEPAPPETPPIEVVEPPPEAPPIDVVEPLPVESPPVPPSLPEEPLNPPREESTSISVFGLASSGIPPLFDAAGSAVVSAGGSDHASASGAAPTRGDPSSPQSKAEDPLLRVPAPEPSTASASPGAAGVAPPSGGAGFGIAADFVGPIFAMLSCALALFLTLPHGAVCALRSERPG